MKIEDGKGTGYKVEVDTKHRLQIESASKSIIHDISSNDKEAYVWHAVGADIDATDTALLVCNDNTTKKLYIEKIYVWTDVPTAIHIHCPAYATWAGTAVTGLNLNRSSSNIALATAKADETGNTQANIILTLHSDENANQTGWGTWIDLGGALILGYHDSIAVDIESEPGDFECSILGYYK